jgi:hypothetical protein
VILVDVLEEDIVMTILLFIGIFIAGLFVLAKIDDGLTHKGWADHNEQRKFEQERRQWNDRALSVTP